MWAIIGNAAFLHYDFPKIKNSSLGLIVKEEFSPSWRSRDAFLSVAKRYLWYVPQADKHTLNGSCL